MDIYTLKITVPSGSHNAKYTPELGEHWPAGETFTMAPKRRQTWPNKIMMDQIGGEAVRVLFPKADFGKYF